MNNGACKKILALLMEASAMALTPLPPPAVSGNFGWMILKERKNSGAEKEKY